MAVLAGVVAAFAVPVAGFEIDGDLVANGTEVDWAPDGGTNVIDATRDADSDSSVFTQSCTQTPVTGYENAVLICDDVKNDADTHEGGDKEENPAGWNYQTSNVTPKTDITNVYALGLFDGGSPVLVNAMERLPKAGSLNLDFEYNQEIDEATNRPIRMEDDVLVAINLGGARASDAAAIEVQLFVAGPGGIYDFDNPDVSETGTGTISGSGITAQVNGATIDSGPWQSFDDQYNLVNTLPAFAFAEVAVDLEEAAGLTNVCFNNVTVRSRASESVTAQLKDTTLPQSFGFCGGLAVEKYIDADESADENSGDVVDAASDTQGDLDGWSFSIYAGADTTDPGDFLCSGTTNAEGVLASCLDGSSNAVDLSTLAPGTYTVQEGVPTSGFFNSDPGPIPTTSAVTKNATIGVGSTTTVKFGNTCYIDKTFQVTGVPDGQSGLFAYYVITTDSAGVDVESGDQVTVEVALSDAGSGTWQATVNDTFTLDNEITWGFGINHNTGDEQSIQVAIGEDFTGSGYPTCAQTNTTTFPTTVVQGSKFKDKANLGTKDSDETSAPAGVAFSFELYAGHDTDPSTGTLVATATYDSTNDSDGSAPSFGDFQFTGIAPGDYTVVEADPPTNWVETFPAMTPAGSGYYNVTVSLGDTTVSADTGANAIVFGNAPESTFTVTFNDLTTFTNATISCNDGSGSQEGDVYSSGSVLVGTYSCTITITDP